MFKFDQGFIKYVVGALISFALYAYYWHYQEFVTVKDFNDNIVVTQRNNILLEIEIINNKLALYGDLRFRESFGPEDAQQLDKLIQDKKFLEEKLRALNAPKKIEIQKYKNN